MSLHSIEPVMFEMPSPLIKCRVRVNFGIDGEHEYLGAYSSSVEALLDAQERYSDMQCKIKIEVLK